MQKKKIDLEIERRFLLKRIPEFPSDKKSLAKLEVFHITQCYVNRNGERVRYRESICHSNDNKSTYYLTKKKFVSAGINEEKEKTITKKTYQKGFKNRIKSISKLRYVYKTKKFKFEIDKFDKQNLVILEIELKDIKQKITFPYFIKKEIILEVTNYKGFSNFNLAKRNK